MEKQEPVVKTKNAENSLNEYPETDAFQKAPENAKWKLVKDDLARPVVLAFTDKHIFVVEQRGTIQVFTPDWSGKRVVLDITQKLSTGWEQGLLGLAPHPRFEENGRLFLHYTDTKDASRIVELKWDGQRLTEGKELFKLEQPYANHNGGHLAFGPDGLLYVGLGDGGSAGDPLGAGQDPKTLLGKLFTLDVDGKAPKPSIVALGLRNPWRYDFDFKNKLLYIADVGQNKWEFVYGISLSELSGANFGWNVVEGSHCYKKANCSSDGFIPPIAEYSHEKGISITGGVVYDGETFPRLKGHYFYADFGTGLIRSIRTDGKKVLAHFDWRPVLDPNKKWGQYSSFARDKAGELYAVTLDGNILKLDLE